MTTFGIEEEYFLVNPATLQPESIAAFVLRDLTLSETRSGSITHESLASQLERSTAVFTDLESAEADLSRFRTDLASTARRQGALAGGTGTPFDAFASPRLTETPRYQTVAGELRGLALDHQISGTHVHVAVPSREAGVHALNRAR
ncbi:glutamate-cysteine ligase family protein [Cryobacterium sp. TMT1-3]|uniref:carboxylate-amine ligase n=1 Tax=Cryobacterium sp. TMT1-3 TaxID=1259237 RepID=UPI00141BD890|nr:glutamate-cysteine ligase family protein [Cryobacterium sp. TMT1-3]